MKACTVCLMKSEDGGGEDVFEDEFLGFAWIRFFADIEEFVNGRVARGAS